MTTNLCDFDAEMAVVGMALACPNLLGKILAEVSDGAIPNLRLREVYRAIRRSAASAESIDAVTVLAAMKPTYDWP